MTIETETEVDTHRIILMSEKALKCECGRIKKVPPDHMGNALDFLLDWHKEHREGKA